MFPFLTFLANILVGIDVCSLKLSDMSLINDLGTVSTMICLGETQDNFFKTKAMKKEEHFKI